MILFIHFTLKNEDKIIISASLQIISEQFELHVSLLVNVEY